jgi:cation diffusion facilitator family transporter
VDNTKRRPRVAVSPSQQVPGELLNPPRSAIRGSLLQTSENQPSGAVLLLAIQLPGSAGRQDLRLSAARDSSLVRNLAKGLSTRTGAIKLSMVVVIGLIVLKVLVSIVSGSISIAAQAADSFLDTFSIVLTLAALKSAATPADEEHQFGHGKAEGLAAMVQAILVLGAGGLIVRSAIQRIIHSTVIRPDEGMAVMLVSVVASLFLSRHLRRVARASGSTVIDALASNISADVYSAAGVLLGLLLVRTTGVAVLDPIIALIVASFVLKAGYEVAVRAIHELSDYALPGDEQERLRKSLNGHSPRIVEFHAIRTRRAGSERFIDLHIVTPRNHGIAEVHELCDHLEQDIKAAVQNANVTIHAEPCSPMDCPRCSIGGCDLRST